MRRRTFVAGLSALAALGTARAQGAPTIRIGWICYTAPGIALEAFQEGMRALGHSGRNAVGIELRVVANNPERVKAAVDELIGAGVVLIMAQAAVGPAVHRVAAGRIPLVFAFSGDPVVAGMAESFARPGGNTSRHVVHGTGTRRQAARSDEGDRPVGAPRCDPHQPAASGRESGARGRRWGRGRAHGREDCVRDDPSRRERMPRSTGSATRGSTASLCSRMQAWSRGPD